MLVFVQANSLIDEAEVFERVLIVPWGVDFWPHYFYDHQVYI